MPTDTAPRLHWCGSPHCPLPLFSSQRATIPYSSLLPSTKILIQTPCSYLFSLYFHLSYSESKKLSSLPGWSCWITRSIASFPFHHIFSKDLIDKHKQGQQMILEFPLEKKIHVTREFFISIAVTTMIGEMLFREKINIRGIWKEESVQPALCSRERAGSHTEQTHRTNAAEEAASVLIPSTRASQEKPRLDPFTKLHLAATTSLRLKPNDRWRKRVN